MPSSKTFLCWLIIISLIRGSTGTQGIAAELRIPAVTAYLLPDPNKGAEKHHKQGLLRWKQHDTKFAWYGQIKKAGSLMASLRLTLPAGKQCRFSLTVEGNSHEVTVRGEKGPVTVLFPPFTITKTGYHSFVLQAQHAIPNPGIDIHTLILEGPTLSEAHFNLNPRLNAASVHLAYPLPKDSKIDAFYCEVTGVEEPIWTFYMACGWRRGYLGIQIISPTERRIIFSVWDGGEETTDNKEKESSRVQLLAKGENVHAARFGHEGTGGHSHLKYYWKTGQPQRLLLTLKPSGSGHSVFSGYYFYPETQKWILISSWKAKASSGLRGLYSFSENTVGENGNVRRKALYGNQWVRSFNGQWSELTTAAFTHDETGRANRLDRFMGVEGKQFFLSHGGFVPGFTRYGDQYKRPSSGRSPEKMSLPPMDLDD